MLVKDRLQVKGRVLYFGIADSQDEKEQVYKQRYQVYSKYKYIDTNLDNELEIDKYDNNSVYVIAKDDGGRLIASVRIIKSNDLPIFSSFKFKVQEKLINSGSGDVSPVELSRLIVNRKGTEDDYIPRNILILFLIKVVLGEIVRSTVVFAYLKESLWKKITLLRVPFTQFEDYECIYPKNGFMSSYFYKNGVVIPGYFNTEKLRGYVTSMLTNNRYFKTGANGTYVLNDTLYISMLRKLGIL